MHRSSVDQTLSTVSAKTGCAVTEFTVERRALINALLHAAQIYGLIAEEAAHLQRLAQTLEARRSGLATDLARAWQVDTAIVLVTDAERDDVWRRIESGVEAVGVLMLAEEEKVGAIVEDIPAEALAPEPRAALSRSVDDSRRAVIQEMLTLRATAEPSVGPERGFTFDRKNIGFDGEPRPPAHIFKLWYGTNREPVVRGGKLTGFSADRADRVHLGSCEVTIPRAHTVGSTGSPWWYRIGRGEDRLRLGTVTALDRLSFWAEVSQQVLANAEVGDAVVFIHGYNVSFEAAALRAAQIGADLALGGAMALFSWPSRGRLLGYPADEATIEASEPYITQFLVDFARRSGARAVHVIAHSMGNRGLLRAVTRIAGNAAAESPKPFGQIILAAPDVDSETFRGLAAAYPLVAARTTLYVSRADLAVRTSRILHGADRIGFTPPITIVNGIDTVNVTGVDLSLLGHGYVGENRSVLHDMFDLLVRNTEPAKRAMLRPLADADGRAYWEIAA